METSIWLPLWFGIVLAAAALPLILLLPQAEATKHIDPGEAENLLQSDVPHQIVHSRPARTQERNPIQSALHGYVSLVRANRIFRLLLTIEFMTGFASATSQLLPRYISKRYGVSFAKVRVHSYRGIARGSHHFRSDTSLP